MELTEQTRWVAGILLLAIVSVESGGLYMLALLRGKAKATPFQITFARAGHAHAGVLVILSLVIQFYADAVTTDGPLAALARSAVPLAAILMPAGFFFSSMGAGRTQPNRAIWLLYTGALSLAAGVTALGLALLLRL
jgi:hypothetical protein